MVDTTPFLRTSRNGSALVLGIFATLPYLVSLAFILVKLCIDLTQCCLHNLQLVPVYRLFSRLHIWTHTWYKWYIC
jgi:hypothetical protein